MMELKQFFKYVCSHKVFATVLTIPHIAHVISIFVALVLSSMCKEWVAKLLASLG